jgi:chromosome segregation ATPase
MKVVSLTLKNVLGLKEFAVDCDGAITVISGRNGSGKSSALVGLRTLIGGGNLATLRSVDAPEGEPAEGVLVLDGDDGRVIVKKTGDKLSVKKQVGDSAAFENVPAPQRYLDALFDAPAANPVQFLTCRDKDRIDLLLQALPLDHTSAEMWAYLGLNPKDFPAIPERLNAMDEIAWTKDAIFKERTGVNTSEKAKRSTADQIRQKIPAEPPAELSADAKQAELDALRAEVAEYRTSAQAKARELKTEASSIVTRREQALASELSAYDAELKSEFQATKSEIDAEIAELRAETERKIAKINGKTVAAKELWSTCYSERVAGGNEIMLATRDEAEKKIHYADAQLEAATDEIRTLTEYAEKLAADIATIREQQKDAVRIQTLREQADTQEDEADGLKALSDRLTAALKALEIYKAELVKDLPIRGLDLTGGEVRVNGVPWAQLNTAQQISIAVQVSCLRFGESKFRPIFVDGAEALDDDQFAILETELEKYEAQAFLARVETHDLSVDSRGK